MRPIAAALLVLGVAGCRGEGRFPDRPIVLICPWGAGGGTDRVARQTALLLEQDLGVNVNVVNATGGQGVTGHSRGALARPDGYTVTMMTVELNMLHARGLTEVTPESFAPLALLNRDAAALFVRADSPWTTLRELEAHIRTSGESLKASGTAQGGIWHLALAGWYARIGDDPARLTWLSSEGAAPSMAELLAGTVDAVCCSLPEAAPQMASGRVRCLGVMSAERATARFPDVPTFREQGYDWTMGGWRGIGVPRDTPEAIRNLLGAALQRVATGAEFAGFMDRQGFDRTYAAADGFRASLAEADRSLGELIRSEAFAAIRRGRHGPLVYPAALGVAAAVVLASLLASGGLRRRDDERTEPAGWRRLLEGVGVVVGFIILAPHLGFLLTMGPLLCLLFLRLGVSPARALATALTLVPATYLLFGTLLRVDLPRGPLGW